MEKNEIQRYFLIVARDYDPRHGDPDWDTYVGKCFPEAALEDRHDWAMGYESFTDTTLVMPSERYAWDLKSLQEITEEQYNNESLRKFWYEQYRVV
jgi:hypothetical protein